MVKVDEDMQRLGSPVAGCLCYTFMRAHHFNRCKRLNRWKRFLQSPSSAHVVVGVTLLDSQIAPRPSAHPPPSSLPLMCSSLPQFCLKQSLFPFRCCCCCCCCYYYYTGHVLVGCCTHLCNENFHSPPHTTSTAVAACGEGITD